MAEYLIQDTTLTAIAEAIRSKTGESGQIAVADMAEKISEIVAGGGGANIVARSGSFKGATTVEHGLGVVPDIIIIYTTGYYSANTTQLVMRHFVGFSSAFRSALLETITNAPGYIYTGVRYLGVVNTYKAYTPSTGTNNTTIDKAAPATNVRNYVHSANENSFSLISNIQTYIPIFESTQTYNWLAIGGLT